MKTSLGWVGIVRLGLVQCAIGSIVALCTSTFNRVMVVELALAASVPAGLVAWHYAIQMSRPHWGFASDSGARRTPWIIGGVGVLALGAVMAADAIALMRGSPILGAALAILAFTMIGVGVGAAGTSLLALMAARTAPARRPAAAAITWILMIVGIVVTAIAAGGMLDPYSDQRLALVTSGVALIAFLVALLAVAGVEGEPVRAEPQGAAAKPRLKDALSEVWRDATARRFTMFVFVSMLAYSTQDLILEPFAGLIFKLTPGQSTQMSGVQHMGVLLGMVLVGSLGGALGKYGAGGRIWMRGWTIGGCAASALALAGLAAAALAGPGWPLKPTVFLLGFANGIFAVAAIGSMMGLAGEGGGGREGTRMGVWGAAQAIAFGLGGFMGAAVVDGLRVALHADAPAFLVVFAAEAGLFALAATLAARVGAADPTVDAAPDAAPMPV
jgi:BCD family chlorophyll transporter-like MFS transporter